MRTRRLRLGIARQAVLLAFVGALLAGGSRALASTARALPVPEWAATASFLGSLYALGSAILFPFTYLSGYVWERRTGLTDRTRASWFRDLAKSNSLGLGATVLAGGVVLWLLARFPEAWWLLAWALGLAATFILGILAPVLLVPLFFRSRPLRDEGLRRRLEDLARSAGTPVVGVYELEASSKTRRSNAAVMGFGRTRRILLTDTLIRDYVPDEIEAVLAHELAHEKFRDPIVGFCQGAAASLFVVAVAALAYGATHRAIGIASLADMAGLPLLALYGGLMSAGLGPIELHLSRRRERRADRFALECTRNPKAFGSAMIKLHDRNLSVAHPKRWEAWLLHSHPSGRERIEAARAFAASA